MRRTAPSRRPCRAFVAFLLLGTAGAARPSDCNKNGAPDAEDLSAGTSSDCNDNETPDECDVLPSLALATRKDWTCAATPFDIAAGDLDGDSLVDIAVACQDANALSLLYSRGTLPGGDLRGFDRRDISVGSGPRSVVLAPLDADSDLDIASANHLDGTVTILRNDGGRVFTSIGVHPTGFNAIDVHAADLDADLDLDLVGANRDVNSFSILKNDGNAGFGPATSFQTVATPDALDVADVDGDGDLDIAVAGETVDQVSIHRNSGTGAFLPGVTLPAGRQPFDVRLADMNGDSFPDLFVANSLADTVSVFRNRGRDGVNWLGFVAAGAVAVTQGPASLDVLDMDADGATDLVVASYSVNVVQVHRGRGDIGFFPPIGQQTGNCPRAVVGADLDGDGNPDLAAANFCSNNVSTILQRPVPVSADANENLVPDECEPDCNLNGVPDDLDITLGTTKDCNMNGLPDRCETDTILSFAPQKFLKVGGQPESVVAADWDGDGGLDLAAANFNGDSISLFKSDGSGGLTARPSLAMKDGPTSVTAADLDEDDCPDLIVAIQFSHQIGVLRNKCDGSGSFVAPLRLNSGLQPVFVAARDIDGDGFEDIASADWESNEVSVFLGTGDGKFTPRMALPGGAGPTAVALGDIDGDLDLDMAVPAFFDTKCLLYKNNGRSGSQWQGYGAPMSLSMGPSQTSAAFGDLDGDGDLDLMTADSGQAPGLPGTPGLSILRNQGDGTFANRVQLPCGTEPVYVAPADLDSDGDVDLLVSNQRSNDMSLFLNEGKGTFTSSRIDTGQGPYTIFVAHLDADGNPDIAVTNRFGDSVSIIRNRTTQPTEEDCNRNSVPDTCDYTAGVLHDEDEDGVADECGRRFHRGDANHDAMIDISDGIFTLTHLFSGGDAPACFEAADADNSAELDISDGVFTFAFLFTGGPAPPPPGPADSPCGTDPDPPGSPGDKGCDRYDHCVP